MGCTVSKAESQLGAIEPWDYAVEGKTVAIDEEELKKIRNDFWQNNAQGDATVWDSLHTCCNDVLEGKLDSANALLQKHGITVVSGDLSLVRDRTGNVYRIEKYCYSTPRNMKSVATEESVATNEMENNKFRFRVGASFLDEEREVIYIFDKGDAKEDSDVVPKEHSPENHLYFHTYHFQDDLNTITEKQVHDKMLSTIENFPEVKGKIRVTNIRLFYLGRELNRNTPFIANRIPFDSVIVVLVQCD
ncbi:Ubiquitin domain-containing protein [Blastocystis sp. ATCC 50177/Nand II]|uniref:Ubiquitin domain-containing protein n=1 Tax=Blastocystis sp. subtype 1 (strain ATCC 50177 / NandII) TaxID=478820 RepID=A0A196SIW5_BLAHN|nr:Ubiquitin domain-containing protein [Blastocystis sp. ATCC 50177/Nand II]